MCDKKTCYKCKHYHAIIGDPDTFYHFHDWCDFWKARIPTRVENADCSFDDVDAELAYCWGFDEVE